ncbi:hypothetical protein M0805_003873 [Coniferiporia weirii]|nr:hypothetical protein M0805_003873 [Coniferiporia weirii]
MAPTQSTPLTSSTLFISIVIIISSVVGASSTLLIIVLIVILRRRLLAARQSAKKKRGHIPKLVITDTSMFPASVVVIEGSAELDKIIASFRPLGSKHPSPGDRPVIDIRKVPGAEGDEKTKQNAVLPEILVSGTGEDLATYHRDSETIYTVGDTSSHTSNHVPKGVWWYDFHLDESGEESIYSESDGSSGDGVSFNYSSARFASIPHTAPLAMANCTNIRASEPESLSDSVTKPSAPSSEKTPPDTSPKDTTRSRLSSSVRADEDIVQGTPIDRQILEYCWEISDNSIGELGDKHIAICDEASPGLETEHANVLTPEKPESAKPRGADPLLEQKILEYCRTITDHGIHKGGCISPSSKSATARYAMAFGPVPGSP